MYLHDFQTGERVASVRVPSPVQSVAVRPDGKHAAIMMDDGLYIWGAATGKKAVLLHQHKDADRRAQVRYSRDGKHLTAALAGRTTSVLRWDLQTAGMMIGRRLTGLVARLALSPDGDTIAASIAPDDVIVWSFATGKARRLWAPKRVRLPELSFSADGKTLLETERRSVRFWDVARGRPIRVVALEGSWDEGNDEPPLLSLDGRALCQAERWSAIRRWDAVTGKELGGDAPAGQVSHLAFSVDGGLVRTLGSDLRRFEWAADTGKALGQGQVCWPWWEEVGSERQPFASPRGTYLAGLFRDGVAVLDMRTGKSRSWHAGHVRLNLAVFSPDEKVLLTAGKGPRAKVWDVRTGKLVSQLNLIDTTPRFDWLAFTPDGKKLLVGVGWRTVYICEAKTGKRLDALRAPAEREPVQEPFWDQGHAIAASPDGRWLAVSCTGNLWLWDLVERRELGPLQTIEHPWRTLAPGPVLFSFDSRYLAWFDEALTLCLYELATGRIVHRLEGARPVSNFSPVAWRLAAAHLDDGTPVLWDLGLLLRSQPLPLDASPAATSTLWDLLAADAPTAHRALWRLAARADAADLLALRLPVVRPLGAQRAAELLRDLAGDDFARRKAAERALAEAREAARLPIQRAWRGEADLEVRLRLGRLLDKLRPRSPEALRDARAVFALEASGSAEARRLLRKLSNGLPEARLTREATAALARLEKR